MRHTAYWRVGILLPLSRAPAPRHRHRCHPDRRVAPFATRSGGIVATLQPSLHRSHANRQSPLHPPRISATSASLRYPLTFFFPLPQFRFSLCTVLSSFLFRGVAEMSVNKVILVGRLGRDPETRYTGGGQAVANFSVATDETFKDRNGVQQKRTEWHKIVAWAQKAEFAQKYLKKGSLIYIEGKIQSREWQDKEGQKRTSYEIIASNFRFIGGKRRWHGRRCRSKRWRQPRRRRRLRSRRSRRGSLRQQPRRRPRNLRRRHSLLDCGVQPTMILVEFHKCFEARMGRHLKCANSV